MNRFSILKTSGFWYLATPYSHPDATVRADRATEAMLLAGKMMAAGIHVYSPIHATHLASVHHELPKDHEYWLAFNKAFLDPAVGVVIGGVPGWASSAGVDQEARYAFAAGKPVFMLEPYSAGPAQISLETWERATKICAKARKEGLATS